MRIKHVHVRRFRSIYDATLACDQLTALVGANGAGKSTFLRALAIFYNPMAPIEISDFYNTAIDEPIHITVCYTDLSDAELAAFRKYVSQGELTVEKRIEWDAQKQRSVQGYYGMTLQHPGFLLIRNPNLQFNQRRTQYNALRLQPEYAELPTITSDATLRLALDTWEQAHPDQCERLASFNQFFGFKQASRARLELYTRFLLIEAQRDAHLAALDERDSPIKQLLDEVVRNVIAENEHVRGLQQQATDALRAISNHIDLRPLNAQLNQTMRQFAPNTAINLTWQDAVLSLPIPRVQLSLSEDGYQTPINRTGHGVQRAFIITLLQHLAMSARQNAEMNAAADDQEEDEGAAEPAIQPNLILAIEEPELYQHPTRQRHFATILHDLAHGTVQGVADSVQILYCTHSPYFVDIERFDQIRVIGKTLGPHIGAPKCTGVRSTTRQALANLNQAQLARMMSSYVNEGFFARLVVLVEGEGDKSLLQLVARHHGIPLEAHGVAIVSVEGKSSFSKPLIVFPAVGIDVYPIWDTDSDQIGGAANQSAQLNRAILTLCGQPEEDWPTGAQQRYAVFDPKLETHIQAEVLSEGLDWQRVEQAAVQIGGARAPWKKHAAVAHAVSFALNNGCTFPTTRTILDRVCELAGIDIRN